MALAHSFWLASICRLAHCSTSFVHFVLPEWNYHYLSLNYCHHLPTQLPVVGPTVWTLGIWSHLVWHQCDGRGDSFQGRDGGGESGDAIGVHFGASPHYLHSEGAFFHLACKPVPGTVTTGNVVGTCNPNSCSSVRCPNWLFGFRVKLLVRECLHYSVHNRIHVR